MSLTDSWGECSLQPQFTGPEILQSSIQWVQHIKMLLGCRLMLLMLSKLPRLLLLMVSSMKGPVLLAGQLVLSSSALAGGGADMVLMMTVMQQSSSSSRGLASTGQAGKLLMQVGSGTSVLFGELQLLGSCNAHQEEHTTPGPCRREQLMRRFARTPCHSPGYDNSQCRSYQLSLRCFTFVPPADFVSPGMWSAMTKGLSKEEKARLKAPLVYQEVMSYIKGSAEALEAGGHLSLEQYQDVRACWLFE